MRDGRIVRGARIATLAVVAVLATGGVAWAQGAGTPTPDTLVNVGSPETPFSQNKQNEPAVAVDQFANRQFENGVPGAEPILAAGSNDEIDMEACNAGPDNDCPFTPGVGVSGIYFSFDGGGSWTQPQYTGYSARLTCLGTAGTDKDVCKPDPDGPIGTLPNYYENNLVSDGDPALAFGPKPDGSGGFTYANGSRLYYANLTSPFPGKQPFKGAEAIAVSHTDHIHRAAAGDNDAWSDPVIASHQTGALFSDKEQIWADNAESSDHFGNVYVCYAAFRGNGRGFTNQPLNVLTSTDGGNSWTQHQVTPATNNVNSRNGFGRSGCTVRTDSDGVVYVFDYQFAFNANGPGAGPIQMIRSFDGGRHWTRPVNLFTAFDTCNYVEPSIGRCVEDGVAGARSDLSPAPSVDIANGAPTGNDATDRLVMSWVDGQLGLNAERVMFSTSPKGGTDWSDPVEVQKGNDRGYYAAPGISPDGQHVWVEYNAFTTPFAESAFEPRELVGVLLHATPAAAEAGALTEVHRGEQGDPRSSSQNNLAAEFLGDYVYAAATRTYGTAVWNDVRNGDDCPAIDEYRQKLHDAASPGTQTAEAEEPRGEQARKHGRGRDQEAEPEAPAVQTACADAPRFGNSDIFGISVPNP